MSRSKYKEANYTITYECGHTARVKIGGYSEEYRKERAQSKSEGFCPDCIHEENMKLYKKKAEQAKEEAIASNLCELDGSDKQINWAVSIRKQLIDTLYEKNIYEFDLPIEVVEKLLQYAGWDRYKIQRAIDRYSEYILNQADIQSILQDSALELLEVALKEESAHTYIERRFEIERRPYDFLMRYFVDPSTQEKERVEKELEKEISLTQTLIPEDFNQITVEISEDENEIIVKSPKNETLRMLVKAKGFKWEEGSWRRKLNSFSGKKEDRIAELGNILLSKKFAVRYNVNDFENIMLKSKNADFEKEQKRWVKFNAEEQKLAICFEQNDALYQRARKIKGSKWKNAVLVPLSNYKQVIDFAEIENFSFSEIAKNKIEEYKKEAEKVTVDVKKPAQTKQVEKLTEILESPSDIIEDLKD